MKAVKLTKSDFRFIPSGFGHYKVTFTSPITGKQWTKIISDMEYIDTTKNQDEPKQVDLIRLKQIVKS